MIRGAGPASLQPTNSHSISPRSRIGVEFIWNMRSRLLLYACLCWLGQAAPALAQQSARPVSVGAGISNLGRTDDKLQGSRAAQGIVGWIDLAVARRLWLEGRVQWFPHDEEPDFGTRGGKTLVAMIGARGRFFGSRYVAVDGLLQTGVVRFTRAGIGYPADELLTAPRSRLGFDMGVSTEFFPQSHWTVRLDVVQTLLVLPQTLLSESTGGALTATSYSIGRVESLGTISGSVGYRFGQPMVASNAVSVGRISVGPSLGYSAIGRAMGEPPHVTASAGGFFSYRLSNYVHADIAVSSLVGRIEPSTLWDGGHAVQALGGVKIGRRLGGTGIFVKARAGAVSHSAAISVLRTVTHRTQETTRSTLPLFELGGVVEVDMSSRTFIRFEGSDLASFYPSRTIVVDGESTSLESEPAAEGLQMSVGVGWRF